MSEQDSRPPATLDEWLEYAQQARRYGSVAVENNLGEAFWEHVDYQFDGDDRPLNLTGARVECAVFDPDTGAVVLPYTVTEQTQDGHLVVEAADPEFHGVGEFRLDITPPEWKWDAIPFIRGEFRVREALSDA